MGVIDVVLWIPLAILGQITRVIEAFLFVLMNWYDIYVYSPLQTFLAPTVAKIPRQVPINGQTYDIFTANVISWSRTFLVVPIAWCLKYDENAVAFLLVILHDFLDHLDGIVAKVQKQIYGQLDDPLLGGFMDAFCDKIVNVSALWTILLITNFDTMSTQAACLYILSAVVIITYEFILGIVRVQDYFRAFYERKFNINYKKSSTVNTAAVMEGKLKEKLESMGIAFLCLAQSSMNAMESLSGKAGIICLLLSVRLAHASLQHKLKSRKQVQINTKITKIIPNTENDFVDEFDKENISSKNNKEIDEISRDKEFDNKDYSEKEKGLEEETVDVDLKEVAHLLLRQNSLPSIGLDGRVDKVYTVGCFDLFHHGHIRLLQRMKALGRQVIVGVHDSRSIFKLKKRVPIDSTEKRMLHVKQYADMVYCIAGTDPTPFLSCIVHKVEGSSSLYVRGDDMQQFPARELCEKLMPVAFLPYSSGVSSTKIRKDQHNASRFGPHVNVEDHSMFY